MVETFCVGVLGAGPAFTDTPLNDLMKDTVILCGGCGEEFETVFDLTKHMTEVERGQRCDECHHYLEDDELECSNESRGEFHGAPCSEVIAHGYKCKECGNDACF